jgi:hypothetical protein
MSGSIGLYCAPPLAETEWPKQVHEFGEKDYAPRTGYKYPEGTEEARDYYGQYYYPGVVEWDLNSDGVAELILSYTHTPGQRKVCHFIYRKEKSGYKLVGKIYHCGITVLKPFNGFNQLEGWAYGSEGVEVRALYQMCSNGQYQNTRMDVYKFTKPDGGGGWDRSSRVFDYIHYPNPCK